MVEKIEVIDAWDEVERGRIAIEGLAGVLDAMRADELRDDVAEQSLAFLSQGAFAAAEHIVRGSGMLKAIVAELGEEPHGLDI